MVPRGKIKTLLQPVGRLFASCGDRGLKANGHAPSSHAANASKPAGLNQQQLSEFRHHHQTISTAASAKETCSKGHEQVPLIEMLQRAFPALRTFSTMPAPAPILAPVPLRSGSRSLGRLAGSAHQQFQMQRRTLLTNATLPSCSLRPAMRGERVGARNFFSSAPSAAFSVSANGGSFCVEQAMRPLAALTNKAAAFWSRGYDAETGDCLAVRECEFTERSKMTRSKAGTNRGKRTTTDKKPLMSKVCAITADKTNGTVSRPLSAKPTPKPRARNVADKENDPSAIVRRSPSAKLRTKKVSAADDVQTYMTFELYSSPIAFGPNELSTFVSMLRGDGMHGSKAQALGTRTATLDPSFIGDLRKIADDHYQHSLAVAAILDALLRHKQLEVELLPSGIRVYMPRGMNVKQARKTLRRWGVNPDSPHFTLEERLRVNKAEPQPAPVASTPTRHVFGLTVSPPLRPVESPAPGSPYIFASAELVDFGGQSSLSSSVMSHFAMEDDSTRGPWNEPSSFWSARDVPEPPIVSPDYYRSIERFLEDVDQLICTSGEFGRHYSRSSLSLSSFHADDVS